MDVVTYALLKKYVDEHGGGENTVAIEITQADYDALSEEEKMDSKKIYFIVDGTADSADYNALINKPLMYFPDTKEVLVNDNYKEFFETLGGEINDFYGLTKVEDYLYDITFTNLDYNYANAYFDNKFPPINPGGCTSVRKDNLYGRNYDWYYDHMPEFIVHVPKINGKHASIAVSQPLEELTENVVDSRISSKYYKLLPFTIVDGINDSGLVANMNVVPANDWGLTTGTVPAVEEREELSAFMVLRFVLDNFDNAQTAVEYLRDYCSIRMLSNSNIALELHYMIADATNTFVVEFTDNEINIINVNDKPYMTNFYLTDAEIDEENNIVVRTSLTPHGSGIERYELIMNEYESIEDKQDMVELMTDKLKYTNCYNKTKTPFWYTEFCGNYETFGDITVTSPISAFDPVVEYSINKYETRTRDEKETWQTVHSSIYNMNDKTMSIICQENNKVIDFSLN